MCELLLAEDDAVSRAFLADAIGRLGYRACVAIDGLAALEQARARRFEVLLLDVNLPGLDGPGVLARLRDDVTAACRASAAVALTADPDPLLHARLHASGFDEVATKPIALAALEALLTRHMRTSRSPRVAKPEAWDDASARRALGGSDSVVAQLRQLMLAELPRQRDRVLSALRAGRRDEARGELHRLQAACGFCGAASLAIAVEALHALATAEAPVTSIDAALERFLADVDRLLGAGA